jgi:hypothetical protein
LTCRLKNVAPRVNTELMIDAHGVAAILGLKHSNSVSNYLKRYDDFPRSTVDLGGSCSPMRPPGRPEVEEGPRVPGAATRV